MFALPLLGWYLIVAPPRKTQGLFRSDLTAPVSDWVRLRLFDDVSQCRATLRDYEQKPPETLPLMLNGIKDGQATIDAAQGVATSDQ
jgi:hypothetical protein